MDPIKPPPLWTSIFGLSCVLIILLSALSLRVYYQSHYLSQKQAQQTPDQALSDTFSGWKTFSDERQTYQIKAPAGWKQDIRSPDFKDMHLITLHASDGSTFQSAATKTQRQNLISYLENLDQVSSTGWEGQPSKSILSTKNVVLGSLPGIERIEQWLAADYTTVVTYLKAGDYIYDFSIQPGDIKYENTEVYKNYSQILSTLEFISPTPSSKNPVACKTGGCSSELCLDSSSPDIASICIYKEEWACLKYSRCEIQSTGKCGWTQTPEYISCLQSY